MNHLIFESIVVHAAVRSYKTNFDNLIFQVNNLPNNNITRTSVIDVAMVEARRIYNLAVIAPRCLYRPFLLQIMFQGVQDIAQLAGKMLLLFLGTAGEVNPPRRFSFSMTHGERVTPGGILSIKKYLIWYF